MQFCVLKLARNTFDVFEGKQWGQTDNHEHNTSWSRLRSGRNGVYVAQGNKLPHAVTKALAAAIDPREEKQEVTVN